MCGRYQLNAKARETADAFDSILRADADLFPRFNVAPTQTLPIVRQDADGKRELVRARWGIAPSWMAPEDDGSVPTGPINARAESAAKKPMFRAAMKSRRCLVPTTGFYEWCKHGQGPKQPFLIRPTADRFLALAGLWERWHGPNDQQVETYTILTSEPNNVIKPIHNRMPVILHPDQYDAWIDPDTPAGDAVSMLDSVKGQGLEAIEIERGINNPKNDSATVVQPVSGD